VSSECTCRDPWCPRCDPPTDGFRCPVCAQWSVDGWCGDMVACCEEAVDHVSDSVGTDEEGQS